MEEKAMNSLPREWAQYVRAAVLALALFAVSACSKSSPDGPGGPAPNTVQPTVTAPQVADAGLTSLFSHIWRMSKAPSQPAPGSIYIYLPNGTLLETSCVETYRVATWTVEKKFPRQLKVVEDRQLAFLATSKS